MLNRVAEVRVGPAGSDGIAIRDVRIAFRVLKTDRRTANEMEVELYNLAPDTRAQLESTDNVVALAAGYEDEGTRGLGLGDLARYETEYQAPDLITRLIAGDGLRALRDTQVSLTYSAGVSAGRIIADIREQLGLGERETDADLSGSYRQGFAFSGPAREALDAVTRRFGLDWSIQDFELQIVASRQPTNRAAVVLTPETGLVGSPQRLDDLASNLSTAKEAPGYTLRSLLQPRLEPGNRVIVESREIDRAEFRIVSVEHVGDTRGQDWHSNLEVVEL